MRLPCSGVELLEIGLGNILVLLWNCVYLAGGAIRRGGE